ncbi:MAG: hypothetical protein ACOZHQ_09045 [Thermodesulfobacteriota bacterium]
MTRIDQFQPGQTAPPGAPKPTARPDGGPSFQQALEEASRPESAAAPAAQPAPAKASAPAAPAQAPRKLDPLQTEGMLRAERALDILEAYQQGLADKKKSLKELGGLVKAMDDEVAELTKVLERMTPEHDLYGLLSEVAVTAMVESVKFNRGDYVPTALVETA